MLNTIQHNRKKLAEAFSAFYLTELADCPLTINPPPLLRDGLLWLVRGGEKMDKTGGRGSFFF